MSRAMIPAEMRFWSYVEKIPFHTCWEWTGWTSRTGYGYFQAEKERRSAHRFAYELMVGQIVEGLTVDHLCRNRHCVNPDHMELVSQGVNTLRGNGVSGVNARKTHCIHGHPFTPENTYVRRAGRHCRECRKNVRQKRKVNLAETIATLRAALATEVGT